LHWAQYCCRLGWPQRKTTSKSTETGTAQFTVAQVTGEVVMVDGNYLLVKMRPSGVQRWFSVNNDRQFINRRTDKDDQSADSRNGSHRDWPFTKTLPVTVRTTTITNGTVLNVSGRNVSVRLENGERRSYTVRIHSGST
jgi:hypothetical protein